MTRKSLNLLNNLLKAHDDYCSRGSQRLEDVPIIESAYSKAFNKFQRHLEAMEAKIHANSTNSRLVCDELESILQSITNSINSLSNR